MDLAVTESSFDPYEALGLSSCASDTDIKESYHKALLRFHPDKISPLTSAEDNERMKAMFHKIQSAWAILSDHQKKIDYDNRIEMEKCIVENAEEICKSEFHFTSGLYVKACRCGCNFEVWSFEIIQEQR
jgi:DnaJ-class molecular chaperone